MHQQNPLDVEQRGYETQIIQNYEFQDLETEVIDDIKSENSITPVDKSFLGKFKRSIGLVLAKLSIELSGTWLSLTKASESCREEVATRACKEDLSNIDTVISSFNITKENLTLRFAHKSPIKALKLLETDQTQSVEIRYRVASKALILNPEKAVEFIQDANLPKEKMTRLWFEIEERNPISALTCREELGIDNAELISNTLTKCIIREPEKVLNNIEHMPSFSVGQQELLATLLHKKLGHEGLEATCAVFNLSEDFLFKFAKQHCETEPKLAISICTTNYLFSDTSKRRELFQILIERDEETAYENILKLVSWCGEEDISKDLTLAKLWKNFAKQKPLEALVNREKFKMEGTEEVSALLTNFIRTNPEEVLQYSQQLPALSATQQELLANIQFEAKGERGLEAIISKFSLTDAIQFPFAKAACRNNPTAAIRNCTEKYLFSDLSKRQALFDILFEINPEAVCKDIAGLANWCGKADLSEGVSKEILYKSWSSICSVRDKLKLPQGFSIQNMLYSRIDRYSNRMIELLPQMNLHTEEWKDELAIKLAKKAPKKIATICTHLQISNEQTLNECFRLYVDQKPKEAKSWSDSINLQLDQRSEVALQDGYLKASPWTALKKILKEEEPDQRMLTKIAVFCANNNATKMCKEIEKIPLKSPNAIAKVFLSCAKKNTWVTMENAEKFSGADDKSKVFNLALHKNPLRALSYRDKFDEVDELTYRTALAYAVKKNANKTLQFLAEQELPEHIETEYICMAIRKFPAGFKDVARDLLIDKGPENRARILAAAKKGNVSKIEKLLKSNRKLSSLNIEIDETFISALALEQFSSAMEGAPNQFKSLFNDQEFVRKVIKIGITTGRWDSALQAAKHFALLTAEEGEVVNTNASMAILDNKVKELEKDDELNATAKNNIMLLKKIRHAQCIPTNLLQRALDHFGADDYEFLFDIMHQGGSTIAEATCQLLLSTYKNECDIREIDQRIIQECIRLGFRGLSSSLLKNLRPVFEESVLEGRKAIKNYQELAGRILQGLPISEELERSPLYYGLVLQAFSPIGMTEESVKNELKRVQDRSEHLERFSYPKEGYGVSLADKGRISLKSGEELDSEKLQAIADYFKVDEETKTLPSHLLLRKLLESGFDQLKPKELWETFKTLTDDPRVEDVVKKLKNFEFETSTPKEQLEAISVISEALSVISYDAVMDIANSATVEGAENGLQITKKIANQTRRILRLPKNKNITRHELLIALDVQAQKLFKQEKLELSKEAKKFNQYIGNLKDRYVMYLSKSKPAYFGRAGAGLCTARETWSWNSETFLQMMLVDNNKNKIVGNIQLHLFTDNDGKKAVLARLNPTSTFLRKVDGKTLAGQMLKVVRDFAKENNLVPYLPEQTYWHQLTNRSSFAPHLTAFYGKTISSRIKITASRTVTRAYKLLENPK